MDERLRELAEDEAWGLLQKAQVLESNGKHGEFAVGLNAEGKWLYAVAVPPSKGTYVIEGPVQELVQGAVSMDAEVSFRLPDADDRTAYEWPVIHTHWGRSPPSVPDVTAAVYRSFVADSALNAYYVRWAPSFVEAFSGERLASAKQRMKAEFSEKATRAFRSFWSWISARDSSVSGYVENNDFMLFALPWVRSQLFRAAGAIEFEASLNDPTSKEWTEILNAWIKRFVESDEWDPQLLAPVAS